MIRVTSCIILAATLAVAGAMDTEQPMRRDGVKDASNMSMPRSISRPKRSRPHITSVEDDLASNFLNVKVSNISNTVTFLTSATIPYNHLISMTNDYLI